MRWSRRPCGTPRPASRAAPGGAASRTPSCGAAPAARTPRSTPCRRPGCPAGRTPACRPTPRTPWAARASACTPQNTALGAQLLEHRLDVIPLPHRDAAVGDDHVRRRPTPGPAPPAPPRGCRAPAAPASAWRRPPTPGRRGSGCWRRGSAPDRARWPAGTSSSPVVTTATTGARLHPDEWIGPPPPAAPARPAAGPPRAQHDLARVHVLAGAPDVASGLRRPTHLHRAAGP